MAKHNRGNADSYANRNTNFHYSRSARHQLNHTADKSQSKR